MKRIALLFAMATVAFGAPLQIKGVLVPQSEMTCQPGDGSIYQVWATGTDPDTVALLVTVNYRINSQMLTATVVSNIGMAGTAPYLSYDSLALLPMASLTPVIVSVSVQQLKASQPQVFTLQEPTPRLLESKASPQ